MMGHSLTSSTKSATYRDHRDPITPSPFRLNSKMSFLFIVMATLMLVTMGLCVVGKGSWKDR